MRDLFLPSVAGKCNSPSDFQNVQSDFALALWHPAQKTLELSAKMNSFGISFEIAFLISEKCFEG